MLRAKVESESVYFRHVLTIYTAGLGCAMYIVV